MSLNWITEKAKAAKDYVMNNPKKAAAVTGVMAVAIATDTARFLSNPVGVGAERLGATALTAAAVYAVEFAYNHRPSMPALTFGRGNNNVPAIEVNHDAPEAPEAPAARGRSPRRRNVAEQNEAPKRSSSRLRNKKQ